MNDAEREFMRLLNDATRATGVAIYYSNSSECTGLEAVEKTGRYLNESYWVAMTTPDPTELEADIVSSCTWVKPGEILNRYKKYPAAEVEAALRRVLEHRDVIVVTIDYRGELLVPRRWYERFWVAR